MRSTTFVGMLPIKLGRLERALGIIALDPFLYRISILNSKNSLNHLITLLLGVFIV